MRKGCTCGSELCKQCGKIHIHYTKKMFPNGKQKIEKIRHNFNGFPCKKCGKIHPDRTGKNNNLYIGTTLSERAEKSRKQAKQWAIDHKDRVKERAKNYYIDNKEKIDVKAEKFRTEHHDLKLKRNRETYIRHRMERIKKASEYQHQEKLNVINHYSKGTLSCFWCGFSDIRALTIDHIYGGGTKHNREIGFGNFYKWLKKNNFPEGYQVLCMNCQREKEHKINPIGNSKPAIYRRKKRELILNYYSGGSMSCVKCGNKNIHSLSIDHIHGGGRKHRDTIGGSTLALYLWIIRNNYPEEFQIICMNCQMIKRLENKECGR